MEQHNFKGPKDKDELMNWLSSDTLAQVRLKKMGIDDINAMWVSERDGKEFKVRWGLNGVADHTIAFEDTGVDGKRYVAMGPAKEVDNSEYDGLLSGEIKPATPDVGAPDIENEAEANQ